MTTIKRFSLAALLDICIAVNEDMLGRAELHAAATTGRSVHYDAMPLLVWERSPRKQLTRLHWAATINDVARARFLLEGGADPVARGKNEGDTPLLWSATSRRGDDVGVLLLTVSRAAFPPSVIDAVCSVYGFNAFTAAMLAKHVQLAITLIDAGADTGAMRKHMTIFHFLAPREPSVVAAAMQVVHARPAAFPPALLNARCRTIHGRTALHWAVSFDNAALTVALIRLGADLGTRDANMCTPLQLMCSSQGADFEGHCAGPLLRAALEREPHLLEANNPFNGCSLLHLAMQFSPLPVIVALIDAGMSTRDEDGEGVTPLFYLAHRATSTTTVTIPDLMEARPAAFSVGVLTTTDLYGCTLLHAAAYVGDEASAVALLGVGVPVDVPVHSCPRAASTPLCFACESGKLEMARLLVSRGADVNAGGGKTPLAHALAHDHGTLAAWLSEQGAR